MGRSDRCMRCRNLPNGTMLCAGDLEPNTGKAPLPTDFSSPKPKPATTIVKGYDDEPEEVKKFWRYYAEREPSEKPDNYKMLPKEVWETYPDFLRAAFLDSGRLRLSEMGDPQEQLRAIKFLKLQGKWEKYPMFMKIGIWFGTLNRDKIIEMQKQVRKRAEEKFKQGIIKAVEEHNRRTMPVDVYVKEKLRKK